MINNYKIKHYKINFNGISMKGSFVHKKPLLKQGFGLESLVLET